MPLTPKEKARNALLLLIKDLKSKQIATERFYEKELAKIDTELETFQIAYESIASTLTSEPKSD